MVRAVALSSTFCGKVVASSKEVLSVSGNVSALFSIVICLLTSFVLFSWVLDLVLLVRERVDGRITVREGLAGR